VAEKKIRLDLPVNYTQEELDAKRDVLTQTVLQHDAVEEEKRVTPKRLGDQMKALRADMRRLSADIRRGHETKPVDCVARFHDPSPSFKTIVRLDTGEIVRTEAMTEDEMQENLFEDGELEKLYNAGDPRQQDPPQEPPPVDGGEQPSA